MACSFVALLLAAAATSVGRVDASGPPRITANVRVTGDDPNPARVAEMPSVLVDRRDPRRVYISEVELLGRHCRLHISHNGGSKFSTATGDPLPASFQFCFPPSSARGPVMTWAPDGKLAMVLDGLNPGADVFTGPTSPILARTGDEGRTWATTIIQDNRQAPEQQASFGPYRESAWMLSVAADAKRNRLYVGWGRRGVVIPDVNNGDPVMRPVVVSSTDGGGTFGPPVDAAADPKAAAVRDFWREDTLVVAPDGTLYDLFPESPPGLVAPLKPNLDLARSTDGGRSFEIIPIDARTAFTDWTDLAIGPPPSGRGDVLVAVYEDIDPSAPRAVQHVFARQSTDGGRTWSAPQRLDDEPTDKAVSQYMPSVAIAPNGRIDVAWYDFRNDDGSFLSDVYYTYSTDGGRTWAPNLRVTDASSDRHYGSFSLVRGPVALDSSDAAAYLAWSDTRNATPQRNLSDIYFAAVQHATPSVPGSRTQAATLGAAVGIGITALGLLAASRFLRRRARRPPAGP